MFSKKVFYVTKTVTTEHMGKKKTVKKETTTEKEPKELKKLEKTMDKLLNLMDEL